jgi:hypothetical protein
MKNEFKILYSIDQCNIVYGRNMGTKHENLKKKSMSTFSTQEFKLYGK